MGGAIALCAAPEVIGQGTAPRSRFGTVAKPIALVLVDCLESDQKDTIGDYDTLQR
ncbi:hypothetical protein [Scytonema sp. HK-05]|uniref:hypothetical protein n=1 Tax=Scytonema sp. HK-05 TaxID=1137095 RepID=UPI000A7F0D1E|nr:hypothetical protein [Scytonema sp. HK-05]